MWGGELRRLAAPHDGRYRLALDFQQAVAPVDNVIPAMLVYHGILRLSPALYQWIHQQRALLARGPQEAELRAVALATRADSRYDRECLYRPRPRVLLVAQW